MPVEGNIAEHKHTISLLISSFCKCGEVERFQSRNLQNDTFQGNCTTKVPAAQINFYLSA